ncbi:uncharacterized protein BJ171DRAFT_623693 [Polychytrium aggregatum]|uniref:uncharacterized protein n=1 Tax=Polychytrium aggregatum TaxID=110093 RepID=UPI0022FE69F5|nr:uncharacterized protein BJ171DRAFT_623693 [Polychytrium aggregatum]KAI9203431.1 hypothetical protein BJ171DRAFT_623693 [Polychytrium aggregatum]
MHSLWHTHSTNFDLKPERLLSPSPHPITQSAQHSPIFSLTSPSGQVPPSPIDGSVIEAFDILDLNNNFNPDLVSTDTIVEPSSMPPQIIVTASDDPKGNASRFRQRAMSEMQCAPAIIESLLPNSLSSIGPLSPQPYSLQNATMDFYAKEFFEILNQDPWGKPSETPTVSSAPGLFNPPNPPRNESSNDTINMECDSGQQQILALAKSGFLDPSTSRAASVPSSANAINAVNSSSLLMLPGSVTSLDQIPDQYVFPQSTSGGQADISPQNLRLSSLSPNPIMTNGLLPSPGLDPLPMASSTHELAFAHRASSLANNFCASDSILFQAVSPDLGSSTPTIDTLQAPLHLRALSNPPTSAPALSELNLHQQSPLLARSPHTPRTSRVISFGPYGVASQAYAAFSPYTNAITWPCQVLGCNRTFVSNAQRRKHYATDHCDDVKLLHPPSPYSMSLATSPTNYYGLSLSPSPIYADPRKSHTPPPIIGFSQDDLATGFDRMTNLDRDPSPAQNQKGRFVCPIQGCDRAFTRNGNLQAHIDSHEGVKRYSCPHANCTSSFVRHNDMKRHLRGHFTSDESLFKCDQCGSSFHRRDAVVRHQKFNCHGRPRNIKSSSPAPNDPEMLSEMVTDDKL